MRLPRVCPLVALLAACATRSPPSSSPPLDADVAGGAHHHCAALPPVGAADVVAASPVIPIDTAAAAGLDPAERTSFEAARPVFARYCWRCHAGGSKKVKASTLAQLDMTSYPFASDHGAAVVPLIRTVVGLDGAPATMPMAGRGCVPAADLDRIAAWTAAYARAREGGAAPSR
jgi:hypothetical protein